MRVSDEERKRLLIQSSEHLRDATVAIQKVRDPATQRALYELRDAVRVQQRLLVDLRPGVRSL